MKLPYHKFHEYFSRSIAKAITFRILIILIDSIIIYLISRRLDFTLGILTISTVVHTGIYIGHERFWNRIHWGKKHTKQK